MGLTRAASWDRVAAFADARLRPSYGVPCSARDLDLHPTDDVVAAVAEIRDDLLSAPRGIVSTLSSERAPVREVRKGSRPAWSPDGRVLAHLDAAGVWIGDLHRDLAGTPERLHWKGDSSTLVLVVAEGGSEMSGLSGSGLLPAADDWAPSVESTDGDLHWRRLVLLDATTGAVSQVGRADLNVWDACWAGERVLAVCSDGSSSESAWYAADLRLVDPETGADELVAAPRAQVGPISASPSGRHLAWVEAISSDRDLVAGELVLLDTTTGDTRRLTSSTDITDLSFVTDDELGFVGLEGLMTRVGFASVGGAVRTLWTGVDSTAVGVHPRATFRPGRAAFVRVGPRVLPEVVLLSDTAPPRVLASVAPPGADVLVEQAGTSRVHRWSAPDGWEIEGWLDVPDGPGPHPLVVLLHGGPMAAHRASWTPLGLLRPLLVARGYAVLMPNQRGSSGRGQRFAAAVVGDMGGADALDITSAIASLVDHQVADPSRIGVTGGSYGGFLAAWLVTQSSVFAAAVAQHPITDWTHQHGSACMPAWDELFLDGEPYATDGQYVARSPLTHAASVATPTLFLAGGLDRATPPGQALAMHRALARHGTSSACVTYPMSAHGPRDTATVVDATARTLDWFERWMPGGAAAPASRDRSEVA